ncbi:hypothetical protein O181_023461 [Austropuccinia psidii MF-1]|uniref:Spindle pole body component n=1 Tax=Austropuccinia psidii MF-1 TaxID=1389203 RepID=A0A9Q3GXN8_9BASI|nr:hypothetical protein [Austropuccinia psidii MF-1]
MSNSRQSKHLQELIRRLVFNHQSQKSQSQSQFNFINDSNFQSNLIQKSNKILKNFNHQINLIDNLLLISNQIINYLENNSSFDPSASQQFTSLLTRLSPLSHPKNKPQTLQFLLALSSHLQSIQTYQNSNHYHASIENFHQNSSHHQSISSHSSQSSSSSSHKSKSSHHLPFKSKNTSNMPNQEHSSNHPHPNSLATKLQTYRRQHHLQQHLPEYLLLKDMIYLLQGIDGKYAYFKLSNSQEESWEEGGIGFNEPLNGQLITPPQRDLILKLTELGWLYKKIQNSISCPDSILGMVQQAFAFALKEELGLYYRAIAIIESHLSSCIETALTLKSLLLHLTPTVLRLRMSTALISATKDLKGGQMISVLHSYTDHGDPLVHLFTSNLLEKVSVPWFKILINWMWDGELVDPIEEFFIKLNVNYHQDDNHHHHHLHHDFINTDGWKVWQNKFGFRKEMVPSFIGEVFARKIFSTGKSLNFIKHSCGDDEWQKTKLELSQTSSKSTLHYKDITGLQKTIDSTYSIANQILFHIFFVKLKLLNHLNALKDYLLMGRGDFISLLIESLGPSLNKPANTLYRHNLTATLESAIRATSNETQLINRLDVRMLEFTSMELGWEVFMLEYKIERPLDVIMSSGSMEKYMKMFKMLWKIRRVEYALDLAWKVIMVDVNKSLKDCHGLINDFRRIRLVLSEMIHFIRQLKSYCQLEVIDCGWQEFKKKLIMNHGLINFDDNVNNNDEMDSDGNNGLGNICDLDSLIESHSNYLERLITKGMLLSTKSGKENTCLLLVEECFKIILEFKALIDNLYNYGLTKTFYHNATRSKSNKGLKGRNQDKVDNDDYDEECNQIEQDEDQEVDYDQMKKKRGMIKLDEELKLIREKIKKHSKLFTEIVLELISNLSTQHDSDMKFLAVRLNFSLYYMRVKNSSLIGSSNIKTK